MLTLNDRGSYAYREAGGLWLEVMPLTFGRARLVVTTPEMRDLCYDDAW